MSAEQDLRDAASAFADAYDAAIAEGLACPWPQSPEQARQLAISETGAVKTEEKPSE